ncbi:MAG TPA: molybdopterin-dependent oxidoreductase [Acidimicrobiia bacterium]
MGDEWHQTACILCSINCGIEVRLDGRRFERIRGDKAHPGSQGYTCEKALRLDHYQNQRGRLTSPLRRRDDGTFEEIDWDTAIGEIAERANAIKAAHGGKSLFYYGGGGQGNHLGGAYGGATRAALGVVYSSNALAQEKTGEFWVDARLFGRARCHTTGDFEHAEVAVFVGKNPWQSHGFPRARTVLKAMANDPERAMIVIDPRRTETADLAEIHLQVRPGTDAFCLSAVAAVLVEEGLVDRRFVEDHTSNAAPLLEALSRVDVTEHCARAGVDEADVRAAARRIGRASSVSILEDLGIQMAPNSTLNSYLEKAIYVLTGNFGRPGTMNIHTKMASLGGSGPSGGGAGSAPGDGMIVPPAGAPNGRPERTTPVSGARIITGLIPANSIPDEILTDHPDRFRAMFIESSNPVHSLADSHRMRDALDSLELVVVLDVAMTETARHAHYVLPTASQFEKWEATFFTLEFPANYFQLRQPLLDPLPGTLPEPEIHRRLVRALGALTDDDIAPLREAATRGRAAFADAFLTATTTDRRLGQLAPVVLYEALGPELPDGAAAAAVMWGLAHTCALAYPEAVKRAGFDGEGLEVGEKLFDAVLNTPSGITFTVDADDESWRRLDTADGRINLFIPELLDELAGLATATPPAGACEWPFVLSAGERRSSTANTIYRDPAWRKKDVTGALRMNPADAARLGIADGGRAAVTTKRATVEAVVELTDTLRPGHITLPNGLGLSYPDEHGVEAVHGVPTNELTASEDKDWLAGTPWHKHVPARVESLA